MTEHSRNVLGTDAPLGWTGTHTLVMDRPDGKAGGSYLGFNRGQLPAGKISIVSASLARGIIVAITAKDDQQ